MPLTVTQARFALNDAFMRLEELARDIERGPVGRTTIQRVTDDAEEALGAYLAAIEGEDRRHAELDDVCVALIRRSDAHTDPRQDEGDDRPVGNYRRLAIAGER